MARPRIDSPNPELDPFPDTLMRGLELIAVRSLGDLEDARDAVQETLTRAMRASKDGRVPDGVGLAAYVHGILRHVVADKQRSRMKERSLHGGRDARAVSAPGDDPLQALVSTERARAVHRALSRLTPPERRLLEDIFVHGERMTDIARRTGVPAQRLRKRKSRALGRLRRLLSFLV